ncbi:MAG: restriction endonuclease [Anaerolineae bacterium]|nr:restriction endonuclease [Anaerolineae bacterium]
MSVTVLTLREWEHATPETTPTLRGLSFGGDAVARRRARELAAAQRLEILELARGLDIQTNSFVGNVTLGPVQLVIRPKLTGLPLLNLLRYAYHLRDLDIQPESDYAVSAATFQDLLIAQLAGEVEELLARGLHREYARTAEPLSSPRGRLDFQTYARQGGVATAALPCIHYPRLDATLLNQVLLAGLNLGAHLTADLTLRVRLRRLAQVFALTLTPAPLHAETLAQAERALDRRTLAYRPALTLIALLLQASGLAFDTPTGLRLPGFLFDMNRFFQALLSRFLHDYLPGYIVHDEYRLKEMFAYVPGHNPRHSRPPTPRPDFSILQHGKLVALLDAKYRDLWEHPLPRDMLYQLSLYALSQPPGATATILYPTLDPTAREARIAIREPALGGERGYVVLRPVGMLDLNEMLTTLTGEKQRRACETLARYFVLGKEPQYEYN